MCQKDCMVLIDDKKHKFTACEAPSGLTFIRHARGRKIG